MAKDRIEVITSVERRRRWGEEEKSRLVAAMNEPGAVVTEIARSAGVEASLLYRWRRQMAAERERPAFVALTVVAETPESATPTRAVGFAEASSARTPAPASITVTFGAQVRVTIEGAPDAATLTKVLGALAAREGWR
jgi:transposase